MPAVAPMMLLEPGVDMFQRGTSPALLVSAPASKDRPASVASRAFTDFEDDLSDFEDYSQGSSNENRKSQTTISTFDEVYTPRDDDAVRRFHFECYAPKSVQGPKGPHLFRASQSSNDFPYNFALQLSPLLPKESVQRLHTAFRDATPDAAVPKREYNDIQSAVAHLEAVEVREWDARQVARWMLQNGFDSDVIDRFQAHDITGAVLLDLQFDDLKELDIQSFGKRHRLWNQIDSLRTHDGLVSPVAPAPTSFEDTARSCTDARQKARSKLRDYRARDQSNGPLVRCSGDDSNAQSTPAAARRRGRRRHDLDDAITPAESVSIVAIEQLLPKPHKCSKGERCAKWRRQQRQLARLEQEHGFSISPDDGGRIFIAGDPGNPLSANRIADNVVRPASDAVPSVVASSDLLGPGQLPEFNLQEGVLQRVGSRDPQENVRQFLTLQGVNQPYQTATPIEAPPSPPLDLFPPQPQVAQPYQPTWAPPASNPDAPALPPASASAKHPSNCVSGPHVHLKSLPKLRIPPPRSLSANAQCPPAAHVAMPPNKTTFSPCRTASPGGIYRFGTPCSDMDAPLTAVRLGPVARDASQSVPPNMQYRDAGLPRSSSRRDHSRQPSLPALPPLAEGCVYSPQRRDSRDRLQNLAGSPTQAQPVAASPSLLPSHTVSTARCIRPPYFIPGAAASVQPIVYDGVNHYGWMKKRRTRLIRHEWQDHHFRLQGTTLAMHQDELPSSSPLQTIDVDDYAVACSSIASNKLSAKLKALKLSSSSSAWGGPTVGRNALQGPKDKHKGSTGSIFEFQLVPAASSTSSAAASSARVEGYRKVLVSHGKTHHFAVKDRDERIDWMRELMLAKALRAKRQGFEVCVNGAGV